MLRESENTSDNSMRTRLLQVQLIDGHYTFGI